MQTSNPQIKSDKKAKWLEMAWWVYVLAAIAFTLRYFWFSLHFPVARDGGWFFITTWEILKGKTLYTDVFDFQYPLIYTIFYWSIKAFGYTQQTYHGLNFFFLMLWVWSCRCLIPDVKSWLMLSCAGLVLILNSHFDCVLERELMAMGPFNFVLFFILQSKKSTSANQFWWLVAALLLSEYMIWIKPFLGIPFLYVSWLYFKTKTSIVKKGLLYLLLLVIPFLLCYPVLNSENLIPFINIQFDYTFGVYSGILSRSLPVLLYQFFDRNTGLMFIVFMALAYWKDFKKVPFEWFIFLFISILVFLVQRKGFLYHIFIFHAIAFPFLFKTLEFNPRKYFLVFLFTLIFFIKNSIPNIRIIPQWEHNLAFMEKAGVHKGDLVQFLDPSFEFPYYCFYLNLSTETKFQGAPFFFYPNNNAFVQKAYTDFFSSLENRPPNFFVVKKNQIFEYHPDLKTFVKQNYLAIPGGKEMMLYKLKSLK